MPGALEDIRVIDFTHALNGPFCTMLLGHLGAEIIKIEPPGGDSFRRILDGARRQNDGYEFLWINVNKKSVALNFKSERGRELARQLIACADVLVENYQKGTMERFGLDYESVKKSQPAADLCLLARLWRVGPHSNYGNTAPATTPCGLGRTRRGRNSGVEGTKALGIGDMAAGSAWPWHFSGVARARTHRRRPKIVVSMQEAVLGFMVSSMHEFFTGNNVGGSADEVADGYFTMRIADLSDAIWASSLACHWPGRSYYRPPGFATATARPAASWPSGGNDSDLGADKNPPRDLQHSATWIFGAPVLSLGRSHGRPHIKTRKAFIHATIPARVPRPCCARDSFSKTPATIHDDAPAIGQHTDEVLGSLLALARRSNRSCASKVS